MPALRRGICSESMPDRFARVRVASPHGKWNGNASANARSMVCASRSSSIMSHPGGETWRSWPNTRCGHQACRAGACRATLFSSSSRGASSMPYIRASLRTVIRRASRPWISPQPLLAKTAAVSGQRRMTSATFISPVISSIAMSSLAHALIRRLKRLSRAASFVSMSLSSMRWVEGCLPSCAIGSRSIQARNE